MEICEKEDDKNPKIITLENCVKITQEPAPANQITIFTKTGTLTLNALNETELKRWVEALQNVAFKDKTNTLTRNSVMEEDNDLYTPSYTDGVFIVDLHAEDTAKLKFSLEPKTYKIQFTATEIKLRNLDILDTEVANWPYRYIRKYGNRDGKFWFEAGRSCDTGEGVFNFHHTNAKDVFRCMGAKVKSMKKLIKGDSLSNLDDVHHQLNAALSMEAGSRSPLPSSDTDQSQSSHLLRGFLNDSANSSMTSSTISTLSSILKITPCKPPRKSIENNEKVKMQKVAKYQDYEPVSLVQNGINDLSKPTSIALKSSPPPPLPKSPIPSNNLSKNNLSMISDHHTINKSPLQSPIVEQPPQIPTRHESMIQDDRNNYEQIENISNAWKTLGVNDIKHTENMKTEDDFTDFVWERSQSQKEFGSNRKINAYDTDNNYDKLDFFATKPANNMGDYRTIVTINTPHAFKKQISQPITSNDYEIMGECGTINTSTNNEQKSCRLADDSYMGYGVLRKPGTNHNNNVSLKSPQSQQQQQSSSADDLLNHRKYSNGIDTYAIVSKPKQV